MLEFVGAGGMGEVYRARDSRLDRVVALKRLLPDLAAAPDLAAFPDTPGAAGPGRTPPGPDSRAARFAREAKALAQLNHPNICTLHDIAAHGGNAILVMEYLQGGTLAARLRKRPLSVAAACELGAQIADALAAAHSLGIVHRDLKPANIMLTAEATGGSGSAHVKLLDFGLSTFTGLGERKAVVLPDTVPTQAEPLTDHGAVVGTLAYMAPEQLEGKPADPRTDIWGLGTILYEMIAGRPAFAGDSAVSLVGDILESQPTALSSLRPETPPALERLVMRCLAKDRGERWQAASDVAAELRWLREHSIGADAVAGVRPQRRRGVRMAALAAAVLSLALGGAGLTWLLGPAIPRKTLAHLSVQVSDADELNAGGFTPTFVRTPGGSRTALAWAPDGQALVFVGRRDGVQQLYVRRLGSATARALPGTEGAQVPVVSADGQWVGFWAKKSIKKVPIGGGLVTDVASGLEAPPWGLVWDDRGGFFFGRWHGPIGRVSPAGTIDNATRLGDGERSHGLPWLLADRQVLLYTVRRRELSWGDEEVVAHTLATGQRKVLLKDATDARYVPTGHLVFLRRGRLLAAPFEPRRLEVGTPVPLLDNVAQELTAGDTSDLTGAGQFAISTGGALAWLSAPVPAYADATLVTVDRGGRVTPLPAPARSYSTFLRLSPDGRRLAVSIATITELGLWVYDLDRGTLAPQVLDGQGVAPRWSPDGERLVFSWLKGGLASMATQFSDFTRPAQVLVPGEFTPSSFTHDGRLLAVRGIGGIVVVTEEHGKVGVQSLIETGKLERAPELSPDGRWLAYNSWASGRSEVYVRPYPGEGVTRQVSVDGGSNPAWSPMNGRELFYIRANGPSNQSQMMAVDFGRGSPTRIGLPRTLFEFDARELDFLSAPVRGYDVSPDGQRFYVIRMATPPPPPAVTHINLILNWFEELKAKVPR